MLLTLEGSGFKLQQSSMFIGQHSLQRHFSQLTHDMGGATWPFVNQLRLMIFNKKTMIFLLFLFNVIIGTL